MSKNKIIMGVLIILSILLSGVLVGMENVSAAVSSCVEKAYKALGATDAEIRKMRSDDDAIQGIVGACESCGTQGATQTAIWINGYSDKGNATEKDAIISIPANEELGTATVYLRVAEYSCGSSIEDPNTQLEKHFINLSGYSYSANKCPYAATRETNLIDGRPSTKTEGNITRALLPNCDGDGVGNVSVNFTKREVFYNFGRFYYIPADDNRDQREGVEGLERPGYGNGDANGGYSRFGGGFVSTSSGLGVGSKANYIASGVYGQTGQYVWTKTGDAKALSLDVKQFTDYVRKKGNNLHDEENRYTSFYQDVYMYSCVLGAYPGMKLEDGFSDACRTNKSSLIVRVNDPKVTTYFYLRDGKGGGGYLDKNGNNSDKKEIGFTYCEYGTNCGADKYETFSGKNFLCWAATESDAKSGNCIKSSKGNIVKSNPYKFSGIKGNKEVYAVYEALSFSGEARVSQGDSYDATKSKKTGFVQSDKGVSITVDCNNADECKASFQFAIARNGETKGKTPYVIWKKVGDGEWGDARSYSTSGNDPVRIYNKRDIKNQTVCYRMVFSIDGTSNEKSFKTVKACATGKLQMVELEAVAIDENGSPIGIELENSKVERGGHASVKRELDDKWTWTGCWSESNRRGKISCEQNIDKSKNIYVAGTNNNTYHVKSLDSSKTIYAVYKKKGGSVTLKAVAIDEDGNPIPGIDPWTTSVSKGEPAKVVREKISGWTWKKCWSESNRRGKISCEQNTDQTKDVYVTGANKTAYHVRSLDKSKTIYAVYKKRTPGGECLQWTPTQSDYNPEPAPEWITTGESGKTTTVSKVMNDSLSDASWKDLVYAKPNDEVAWIHCDFPGVQRMANVQVTVKFDMKTRRSTYDKMSNVESWSNEYEVTSSQFNTGGYNNKNSAEFGDTSVMEDPENAHVVELLEVGKTLSETMTAGGPSEASAWLNGRFENYILHETKNDPPATSHADVVVPYNFINTIEIKTEQEDEEDKIVYAGETKTIDFEIYTRKKKNELTEGYYATMVKNAKYSFEICYKEAGAGEIANMNGEGETCVNTTETLTSGESGGERGVLNSTGLGLGGSEEDDNDYVIHLERGSFNIPDIKAGSGVCVRSRVYPQNSGGDGNTDPNGNRQWEKSDRLCFIVAKKPSFQVWGGGVYSAKNIDVPVSLKDKNVFSANSSKRFDVDGKKYAFGSWTELALIADGTVKGLSSGAGAGYSGNNGGNLVANPGGGDVNYCYRSTLSFANKDCSSGKVGDMGGVGKNKNVIVDRESLKESLKANIDSIGGGISYVHENGDVELASEDEAIVLYGGNYLTESDGDIMINGDIMYREEYNNLSEMPKYIIYAHGDIRISCSVNRIDAVLIAEGDVNTCVIDGEDDDEKNLDAINDERRSNRLVINGALIADTLTLGRTYGAGTGDDSIVPAEIINYDTSLYLWAYNGTKTNTSGESNIVYQQEVAPRL